MPDLRPVLFALGAILAVLAMAMLLPALVEAPDGQWQVFATSAALTLFVGVTLVLSNREHGFTLTLRQAFLLTTSVWVLTALFGAVPFMVADAQLSFTDAMFESMSGVTTTGSTVVTGLDDAIGDGVLLWRSLLQWLGGIGVIVMALSLLPMLRVGGMQLFRTESTDKSEKVLPKLAQMGGGIVGIYLVLSLACAALYVWSGMTWWHAINHTMTTVATGGFSTSDRSIENFGAQAEWVAMGFMIAGALPFMGYLRTVVADPVALARDSQVRAFLAILATMIAAMTAFVILRAGMDPTTGIRAAAVNVTSIITGTGYTTTDYSVWGGFALIVFLFIMFIGGCAGSTTCGMKVFRFQVMYENARAMLLRMYQPHRIVLPRFNGQPLGQDVMQSVLSFFFVYVMVFVLGAVALAAMGLAPVTALSSAATAINNVGPGLGEIGGPRGTFAALPDGAKWVMMVLFLLGRLELFTVLVLLNPAFWRH